MGHDPYAEGLEACDAGKPLSSNPYLKGSDEYESWVEGWHAGQAADGDEVATDETT